MASYVVHDSEADLAYLFIGQFTTVLAQSLMHDVMASSTEWQQSVIRLTSQGPAVAKMV